MEMAKSLSFNSSSNRDSSSMERRREGNVVNGSTLIFNSPSLVFDHHHHHHQQQQQQQQQSRHLKHQSSPSPRSPQKQSNNERDHDQLIPDTKSESDHDPDPVSVSIAVPGVTGGGGGPILSKSNPRTPSATTATTTTAKASASSVSVRYRECLKNHAASTGGHVVDGCGEFMPSGEDGSIGALKCAACSCHRNFHRKEIEEKQPQCRLLPPPQPLHFQKISLGSPPLTPFQPTMMAFGGGATESSSEDINLFNTNHEVSARQASSFGQSKKRFRTKFTPDQKERMLEFADKVGWRFQKQDEPEIQLFCSEVGINREVLKVWMHNNKHAMKMKQLQQQQLHHQDEQQQPL